MKRWVLIVVVGLLALGRPAHAADLQYTSFTADITVESNASILVKETIGVDFLTDLHGIYRNIPYAYTTLNGGRATIPIDQISVTQDGTEAQVVQTKDAQYIKLKIGDSEVTLSGAHTYVISYRAQAAANFFADHDELYWNVTGDKWDEPMSNAQASVRYPAGAEAAKIQLACYTGPAGSKATDCTKTVGSGVATFTAQDYLTVVVGWPKGLISKPANFDALRHEAAKYTPSWRSPLSIALNGVLPIIALAVMWWLWSTRGRDPEERGTIVAQYDPPEGLRPAEVGVLLNVQANSTCVSATIIDLAVRKYLRIEEAEKPTFLGLKHKTDFVLVELRPADDQLRPYERDLLEALFRNPKVPAIDSRVKLSDFVKKKTAVTSFKKVISDMTKDMVERGYFTTDPAKARLVPSVVGGIFIALGAELIRSGTFIPGFIVAGAIIFGFGWFMPRKTQLGANAAWTAKGFKLFLKTAEKYRLQWQERQNIFETFLPYAMVFGVARHWSETLAPVVNEAPDWYVGTAGSQFNAVVFYSSMSSFNTMLSTSAVSGAASGSSGFGGGGFSGGGGGGGGGGGW